jgi:CheY-like chemotaxis protein
MPNVQESHQPRVLLVENDPRTRLAQEALLKYWGYKPILALGEGPELIQDAKEKAHKARCNLAVIDLRLLDDFDEEDTSGLKLAQEIGPLCCIMLSGHGNPKILREILDKNYHIRFISKADARETIQKVLEEEAQKVSAAKRGLVIIPPNAIEQIIQTELGTEAGEYPDQIADVLAQLFPNAKNLKVEKLETKSLSSNISTVPRPKSVVLKVYEEDLEPVAVKLARAKKIAIEAERYDEFIFRRLTGNFSARMERHVELWDIGGVSYSYIGDFDVKTFSHYYEAQTIENIEECLRTFFCSTWNRHYAKARAVENVSLFKLYNKVWNEWYEKRVQKFVMPISLQALNAHTRFKMLNPIQWLKEHVVENPENDASRVASTKLAVTHGDLHAENLLIDSKKNAWVIDFERSGEGHALQDFIELEADLLNRLPDGSDNYPEFFNLWLTAIQPAELAPLPLPEQIPAHPEFHKAIQTVSLLRKLAQQCTEISDFRQYLWGLLFNALFRATIITKDENHKKSQMRALMLASIICHRLEHWDESWPPAEWKTDATQITAGKDMTQA